MISIKVQQNICIIAIKMMDVSVLMEINVSFTKVIWKDQVIVASWSKTLSSSDKDGMKVMMRFSFHSAAYRKRRIYSMIKQQMEFLVWACQSQKLLRHRNQFSGPCMTLTLSIE